MKMKSEILENHALAANWLGHLKASHLLGRMLSLAGCTVLAIFLHVGQAVAHGDSLVCPDLADISHWDWGSDVSRETVKVLASRFQLEVSGSYYLTGKCASEFNGFVKNGNFDLMGKSMSEGYAHGDAGWRRLNWIEPGQVELYPKMEGMQFQLGARINLRDPQDSVGIWRSKSNWMVYHYRRSGKGSFSSIEPMLQSDKPLLAISLIPFLHNDYGYLHLAQSTDQKDVLKIVRVYWSYKFESRPNDR